MANHKKAWSQDDDTYAKFDFPKVTAANTFVVPKNESAISGNVREHQKPTGTYKYRCPSCDCYYSEKVVHVCKV